LIEAVIVVEPILSEHRDDVVLYNVLQVCTIIQIAEIAMAYAEP
jgi:hypothetical protein